MSIYTRFHETGTLDDMVSCPYVPSHVMSAGRLQIHLIKCRKQHPDKALLMQICPYNQTHHVLKEDFERHLIVCPQYHQAQRSLSHQKMQEFPLDKGGPGRDGNQGGSSNSSTDPKFDEEYAKDWQ